VEAAPSLSSPLGRISISHEAVAHIVGRVAEVEVRIQDVKRSTA